MKKKIKIEYKIKGLSNLSIKQFIAFTWLPSLRVEERLG